MILARIHLAHILPGEDELGEHQFPHFPPVLWRLWTIAGSLACGFVAASEKLAAALKEWKNSLGQRKGRFRSLGEADQNQGRVKRPA